MNTNYDYTTQSYSYNNPGFNTYTTQPSQNQPSARAKTRLPIIILIVTGLVLLAILLALLLNNTGSQNNNNTSNQKVVLQWWGVFLDEDVVQPLIDEYQAQNDNVTIEYANQWIAEGNFEDQEEDYRSRLNTLLRSGESEKIPDIFMVHNTWTGDYEKYSRQSTTYSYTDFNNVFYPAIVEDFAKNQTVYGVPLWMDTLSIIYNKDLLENEAVTAPPKTWPEFKDLAVDLTTRSNNSITQAGFAAGTTNNVSFSTQMLYLLFAQNGVQFTDSSNKVIFANDSDSVDALNFYKSFATSSGSWNTSLENDAASFLDKKAAMIIGTSWRYRDLLYFNDTYDIGIDMAIAQIPQLQGQSESLINWADYWGNMVALSRPTANTTEAWKFLRWLTQPEQLKKLSDNEKNSNKYFGILYPRKDMATELQSDQYLKTFNESLPFAKTWYQVKGIEVRNRMKEAIDGGASQGTLTSAQDDVQQLINSKGNLP